MFVCVCFKSLHPFGWLSRDIESLQILDFHICVRGIWAARVWCAWCINMQFFAKNSRRSLRSDIHYSSLGLLWTVFLSVFTFLFFFVMKKDIPSYDITSCLASSVTIPKHFVAPVKFTFFWERLSVCLDQNYKVSLKKIPFWFHSNYHVSCIF